MRRFAALLLSLALLLPIGACAPETVAGTPSILPSETARAAVSAPIEEKSPWLEDYDYFWVLVEENFALYAAAERITGRDFTTIKEEYRSRAEQVEDADGLYGILYMCTREFEETGHFSIVNPEFYKYSMELFWQYREDEKQAFLYRRIATPEAMAYYGYTPTTEQEIYLSELSVQNVTQEVSYNLHFMDYRDESTVYMSIRGMTVENENSDGEILRAFFREAETQGYKNCIVDIRGNGGGSDTYWRANLVAPNISESMVAYNYSLIKGTDALAHHEAWRYSNLRPIEELPIGELPNLNMADLKGITHFEQYGIGAEAGGDTPLFTGRFWLLTDIGVYSAAESFANFCKQTGFATLVGESTNGDGIGIEPLYSTLPNSGICVRFSDENGLNADGSCNEEYGTRPDIPNAGGMNALDTCLIAIGAENGGK